MTPKVLVSGCFDLLHSGHVEFFREVAAYGDVYVALGSDRTIFGIKGRAPVNNEQERLFMVKSVAYVKGAFISQGSGLLDFVEEMRELKPEFFVVNEDGNLPAKRQLCEEMGVHYVILRREPQAGLPARSTTALKTLDLFPYRIDLAGGWLDQPFVSQYYPGAVITISLEPTIEFNDRSGMATSTRRKAIDLWGPRLPPGEPQKLAKILFCWDNPPGTKIISGSQDAIGLVMPGANKSWYEGEYWPARIDSIYDELTLQFIEQSLYLIPLGQRVEGYDVLSNTRIDQTGARALSDATEGCWEAIQQKDRVRFGLHVRQAFEAQIAMFPNMLNDTIRGLIQQYEKTALGWKISGAGGGGYFIMISEKPIENAIRIYIRRKDVV